MNFIVSKRFDLLWIIGPSFFSSLFVLIFSSFTNTPQEMSPLYWLVFVVFIDVSHVWSTLFRTYLHKENKIRFQKELWLVPLFCYGGGVILHSFGYIVFWRVLAYLAVFHFIRQQYGIFKLYSRKENVTNRFVKIDLVTIYTATIIPLLIWHVRGPQEIHWFINGDFLYFPELTYTFYLQILAILILGAYGFKEFIILRSSFFSPKNLFLYGTYLSWWLGIVWLNNDWSFTITNVVSHGIPYFALIYIYNLKSRENLIWPKSLPMICIFIFLFILGYLEEGLWDVFIWKEHTQIFPIFKSTVLIENSALLALVVPLLTLPQSTHYILDGFIWKQNNTEY